MNRHAPRIQRRTLPLTEDEIRAIVFLVGCGRSHCVVRLRGLTGRDSATRMRATDRASAKRMSSGEGAPRQSRHALTSPGGPLPPRSPSLAASTKRGARSLRSSSTSPPHRSGALRAQAFGTSGCSSSISTDCGRRACPRNDPLTVKPDARDPPVVTVLGLQVAQVAGGSVIIATVFGIPGMEQFLVAAR
jgi:hypothetical protein